ncbi:SH3 domain-containing protein, partial [Pseudoxanthomonas putridarboris]
MNTPVKTLTPTTSFGYPFKTKEEKEFADPLEFYKGLAMVTGGHYLLGTHGLWHGGIHFSKASANTFSQEGGVRCIADGEVVAYRIDNRYPDGKPGGIAGSTPILPYSTGFVLVRHSLQPPKLPAPQTTAGARPAPQPQPPRPLTVYSLYMHLGDYASYLAAPQRPTPAWWKGPKRHEVKNTNRDDNPQAQGQQPGLNIRKAGSARSEKIGWLSRGAQLTISEKSADGKWGKVSSVLSGTCELYGTADATAPKGWVHLGSLRAQGTPDAFDRVVVLAEPSPVRAGDVIGYLGEDVPASVRPIGNGPMTRPLLHLEVFSGDDVEAFIRQCRRYA